MADVFISYEKSDKDEAERLATILTRRGWSVFWDRYIPLGESFSSVLEEELERAGCVVVIWSDHSIRSDWVHAEAAEAANRKILVPIRVQDCKLPLEFRRLQTANLIEWDGDEDDATFQEVIRAIANRLTRSIESTLDEIKRTTREHSPTLSGPARLNGVAEQQKPTAPEASRFFAPALDIKETPDAYFVAVELPGVKGEDVQLSVEDGLLVIEGSKAFPDSAHLTHHRIERRYGAFRRSITLPGDIKQEGIESNLENGMLSIRVPKD